MMEKLFNIVKKGYEQVEVDKYIETLEAMIKSYKEKDESIKNAIINAQIAADNIVKNAELEAEKIKFRAIKALNEIQTSISAQKDITKDFQTEYNRLTNKYLHSIGNSEIDNVFSKIGDLEDFIFNINKANDTMGLLGSPKSRSEALPKEVVFESDKSRLAGAQTPGANHRPARADAQIALNPKSEPFVSPAPTSASVLDEAAVSAPGGAPAETLTEATKEPAQITEHKEEAKEEAKDEGRLELMNELFGPRLDEPPKNTKEQDSRKNRRR